MASVNFVRWTCDGCEKTEEVKRGVPEGWLIFKIMNNHALRESDTIKKHACMACYELLPPWLSGLPLPDEQPEHVEHPEHIEVYR